MQCPYCQATIADDSVVCTKCGEVLSGDANATKKYDIESELRAAASSVAALPDDTGMIAKKKLLHRLMEFALLFFALGFLTVGATGYLQGWFDAARSDFVIEDFRTDAEFYREAGVDVVQSDVMKLLGIGVGRQLVQEDILAEGVRLSWLQGDIIEAEINGDKLWVLHAPNADLVRYVDGTHGKSLGAFMKHDVYEVDLGKVFRDGGVGVQSILGNYLLFATSEDLLKQVVSNVEMQAAEGGNSRRVKDAMARLGVDHDVWWHGVGPDLVRELGFATDWFGMSDFVALAFRTKESVGEISFFVESPKNATGLLGRAISHKGDLLDSIPDLNGVAMLLNAADVKSAYMELLSAYDLEQFAFELWLKQNVGLDFRNDILTLSKEEALMIVHSKRKGVEASLDLVVKMDDEGMVEKKLNKITERIALYFGEDAENDFSLVSDGGTTKWQAVKKPTDLSQIVHRGSEVFGRSLGKVAGRDAGFYYAIEDDRLVMSSSLAGIKRTLDHLKMPEVMMSEAFAQMFGTERKKNLLNAFVDVPALNTLFPEFSEAWLPITSATLKAAYEGDEIVGSLQIK